MAVTAKDLNYWLATPTGSGMDSEYCSALVRTLNHLQDSGYRRPKYATGHAPEVQNLNQMLETMMAFTKEEAGIFWVGADHSWTPEDYCRLLEAAAAHPDAVVGAVYPLSDGTRLVGEATKDATVEGDLAQADSLGWGFLWTPFSAFRKIRPPYWEWRVRSDPRLGSMRLFHLVSPDVYFCQKAKNAGVDLFIHRHVLEVAHAQRLPQPHLTTAEWMRRRA